MAAEALADGLAELFEVQGGREFAKLLDAETDGLRSLLVRRALQNLAPEEVDALLAGLEPEPAAFVVDSAVLQALNTAPSSSQPIASPQPSPPDTSPPKPSLPAALTVTAVTPQTPIVVRTSGVTLRVVRGTPGLGGGITDPARSTDAEDWAELFERSQGRFPLKVAHLHGSSAFGCDVLSFDSEADQATFKLTADRTLISRLIEVKSGQVQLTDNEIRTARRHTTRFHLPYCL